MYMLAKKSYSSSSMFLAKRLRLITLFLTVIITLIPLFNNPLMPIAIDESTGDIFRIFYFGYQGPSLKDGFYDLLNVDAALKAEFDLILGFRNPLSAFSSLVIMIILSLLYAVFIFLFAKKLSARLYVVPLIALLAYTSPSFKLGRNPPSISAILTLTTIYILVMLTRSGCSNIVSATIATAMAFSSATLAHGTALVVVVTSIIISISSNPSSSCHISPT